MDGDPIPDKRIIGCKETAPNLTPFPDPVLPKPTHWLCDDCNELLPASDFPNLAPKIGKKNICGLCEKSRVAEKTVLRRRDELLRSIHDKSLKPGKVPGDYAPTLGNLVTEMMYRFGGVEAFCELYHQHILCSLADKPGGKVGLDHLHSLAKMAAEVQKIETQKRAVDRLDEADMAREIEMYMRKLHPPDKADVVKQEIIEFDPT